MPGESEAPSRGSSKGSHPSDHRAPERSEDRVPKELIRATYLLQGEPEEASDRGMALCVEQTIEFPPELVRDQDIFDRVVARLESIEPIDQRTTRIRVAYPAAVAGKGDLLQFLNVLFGNISLQPGIRLVDVEIPPSLLASLPGPRYGREGLRRLLGVHGRPLLATALKPLGSSPRELATLARQVTLGGVDIIKDDHGLTNQDFAPFDERVARCAEAIAEAAVQRGRPCLYLVNATGPIEGLAERARLVRRRGAQGLVLAPGLVGFDALRALAEDDDLALVLASHPSFLGSFVTSPTSGVAHELILGLIPRLAGADLTIFPSFGGRFSFSEEECRSVVAGATRRLGPIRPIFPTPAGGMTLDRVPRLVEVYGSDTVLLVGGDLHRQGDDPGEGARRFLERIEAAGGRG